MGLVYAICIYVTVMYFGLYVRLLIMAIGVISLMLCLAFGNLFLMLDWGSSWFYDSLICHTLQNITGGLSVSEQLWRQEGLGGSEERRRQGMRGEEGAKTAIKV